MEQTNGFVGGAVNGAIVGTISAIPEAGPAAGYFANGISTAAEGRMSYYIWQGFSNLAGFSAGGSVYIGADYASRKMLDNCTTNE